MQKQHVAVRPEMCLSAAIARDDWETAGRMMEKDIFHEPYRKKLFPEFERIRASLP